jgi:hypothetical protein
MDLRSQKVAGNSILLEFYEIYRVQPIYLLLKMNK